MYVATSDSRSPGLHDPGVYGSHLVVDPVWAMVDPISEIEDPSGGSSFGNGGSNFGSGGSNLGNNGSNFGSGGSNSAMVVAISVLPLCTIDVIRQEAWPEDTSEGQAL